MTVQDHALAANKEATPAAFGTAALFLSVIVFGALAGLTLPSAGDKISLGIDTTLRVLIFLLFFEMRFASILKAFGNVRFLAIAWGANFLMIPIIGFAVASLVFWDQPLFLAGLMIYFLAPCTDWFLGFTRMAKGDTELGAALIPVNIVTQLVLFPLWLLVFANATGLVEFGAMPGMLMSWFILPLLAAQALRLALDRLLARGAVERIMSAVSFVLPFVLAALIFQLFAAHVGMIAAHLSLFALVALAVCLFFAATLAAGELLSRLGRLGYPQQALLSMTLTARNAPLMLALTAVAIPDQPLILAVIVSGMLVEIPLLTLLKQRLLKRSERT